MVLGRAFIFRSVPTGPLKNTVGVKESTMTTNVNNKREIMFVKLCVSRVITYIHYLSIISNFSNFSNFSNK